MPRLGIILAAAVLSWQTPSALAAEAPWRAGVARINITPELRRNVRLELYEAGHMMYVHPGSMGKFSEHIKTFLDENAK